MESKKAEKKQLETESFVMVTNYDSFSSFIPFLFLFFEILFIRSIIVTKKKCKKKTRDGFPFVR